MTEFIEVARLDQVPVGTGNCFTVAGKDVALFNVDGAIYAMEDSCQHKGSSLGAGQLDGKVVTCRAHGWRYDVTTGSNGSCKKTVWCNAGTGYDGPTGWGTPNGTGAFTG